MITSSDKMGQFYYISESFKLKISLVAKYDKVLRIFLDHTHLHSTHAIVNTKYVSHKAGKLAIMLRRYLALPLIKIIFLLLQVMAHPDDLCRNLEAMSMSSLATEIASPPPPPPPLGLERFHSLSKNYGKSQGGGFSFIKSFNEQHNESYFGDTLRSRGGEKCSRFSRESSVESDKSSVGSSFSIASKSSTLSRLFTKKGRAGMVSRPLFGRSASIDSVSVTSAKQGPPMGAPTWSTPGTPNPSESYGTLRGRSRERCPATPTLGDRIRHAWNNEKQKVGK